ALDMLFDRRQQRREGHAAQVPDPSVFPLAMPLIAGPGAMTSMILLVNQTDEWSGTLAVLGVMLLVVATCFIFFLLAPPLERLLGRTGEMVVTRLLGMLLAALSVQFVINGARAAGII
ncbi:MAG: MarC family protein, partial [Pararhodobacter sp.]